MKKERNRLVSITVTVAFFVLFMPALSLVHAQEGSVLIPIGKAGEAKSKITFLGITRPGLLTAKDKKLIKEFMLLLNTDFSFYKSFFEVASSKSLKTVPGNPRYNYWMRKNISLVTKVVFQKKTNLLFDIKSYSVVQKESIFEQQGVLTPKNIRSIGHAIAHKLYTRISGRKQSIFNSKIIFVSDRNGRRKKPVKELYIMDFDGGNKRRLTYHRGLVISPAISPDGKKVLYSLIQKRRRGRKGKRNINLFLMDIATKKTFRLSSRRGLNTGAVFMPDGKNLLLTLSHTGNAEIYIMNISSRTLRRLTYHYTPDVDPSINRRGDKMVFLSGRPGMPMIYTAGVHGLENNVKRISFVGQFNATPRFSPDGKEIAFSSWLDGRFDIFRINADGTGLYRLTKDFGSNEDPTWSNDGRFIAFTSQRVLSRTKALHNIYVMDREGEIVGSVTHNFGNATSPRWSR